VTIETVPALHAASRRGRAFTLIEILATLVLVAIILPVAMSGISLALNTADSSRRETEAAALARTKMDEILATQQWINTALSGDFAPDQPDYRWSALVSNWQGGNLQGPQLRQLDVQVTWRQRNRDRGITLSTLIYAGTAQ